MLELYLQSPIHLHGVVHNESQGDFLFTHLYFLIYVYLYSHVNYICKKLVRKYEKIIHMTTEEADVRRHAVKGKTKEQRNRSQSVTHWQTEKVYGSV
jgi:hypothetical protein